MMACPGPQANIMSQYARIHNKLGVMLGPGVEREPQVRRQYNVLTGMRAYTLKSLSLLDLAGVIRVSSEKMCSKRDIGIKNLFIYLFLPYFKHIYFDHDK